MRYGVGMPWYGAPICFAVGFLLTGLLARIGKPPAERKDQSALILTGLMVSIAILVLALFVPMVRS